MLVEKNADETKSRQIFRQLERAARKSQKFPSAASTYYYDEIECSMKCFHKEFHENFLKYLKKTNVSIYLLQFFPIFLTVFFFQL